MKKSRSSKTAAKNEIANEADRENFLIVGIGASAGGIQALKDFFENVPADSGLAYVVILHLSPDHDSRLAEVLQTVAQIPVTQVTEKVYLKPNHVYVVPPNRSLSMQDGHIIFSPIHTVEERRAPVDIFFRTLAESHDSRAIAVILSGTGADGSMGIKRVKEKGGVAFVQNPREAEFSEMPRNSIATNLIDGVLNIQHRANIEAANLEVQTNGQSETINLHVRPVLREEDTAHGFLLVLFETKQETEETKEEAKLISTSSEPIVSQLEEELERVKAQLRTSVEQFEAQTEELRASNEELQAMNEELRSSAEELETSREELQSVNEELITVNQELKIKIEELSLSNNDFQNLMNSTDIGTIFLDRVLRVKMFTPRVREIFNLIEADLNRPLADITTTLNFDDLHHDVERVLDTLHTAEREVETQNGKWYLMRLIPYRTSEDRISGVVITFVDITERKQAEETLRESEERYRSLFDSIDEGFSLCEMLFDEAGKAVDYRFIEVNPAFEKFTGFKKAAGKRIRELVPSIEDSWFEVYGKVVRTGEAVRFENRAAGLDSWYDVFASRVGGADSHRFVVTFSDITRRKLAQEKLLESEKFVRSTLNSLIPSIAILDREGAIIDVNNNWTRFAEENQCGVSESNVGESYLDVVRQAVASGEADSKIIYEGIEAVLNGRQPKFEFEYPCHSPTEKRWFFMNVSPLETAQGGAVVSHTDITPRKLAELNVEFLASVSTDLTRLSTIDEMMKTVGAKIGEFLNLSNCAFFEIDEAADEAIVTHDWHRADMMSLVGTYRIGDFVTNEFHQTVRAGEVFVVRDTISDSRTDAEQYRAIDVGAFVSVPIIQNGEWRFLMVMFDSKVHDWRVDEIELMSELTRRIWASVERRRAEIALRESEERSRLLIEGATDFAIFRVANDGSIASWNSGAEKVFGWTESEIIGQPGAVLFTPEDRENGIPQKEMQTALEKGRAADERWHLRKDGSRFYVSGVMSRLSEGAEGFVKIARDMTKKILTEKTLRDKEMLQKLVGAQEDERKRIARDLHDHLGQQLTDLRLKLEAARKMSEKDDKLSAKIDETQLVAKRIDADVDFLAWELRPAALDDLGLIVALENYVKEWAHFSGITAEFFTFLLSKERFLPESEINLYRIAQEALNNVYKHAKAKHASVILEKRNGLLILIIEDDGIGFDAEDKEARQRGLGLIGMQERAALIGGAKEIESEKGTGTTIYVRVPVSELKNGNHWDENIIE